MKHAVDVEAESIVYQLYVVYLDVQYSMYKAVHDCIIRCTFNTLPHFSNIL